MKNKNNNAENKNTGPREKKATQALQQNKVEGHSQDADRHSKQRHPQEKQ